MPANRPLPVKISEDYAEGLRIINRMLDLGKFQKIKSNTGGHDGIVVAKREK